MENEQFQQMVMGKLDIHMQMNKVRNLTTLHCKQVTKWIKDLKHPKSLNCKTLRRKQKGKVF